LSESESSKQQNLNKSMIARTIAHLKEGLLLPQPAQTDILSVSALTSPP